MDTPDSPSELDRLLALRETGLLDRPTPPEFQAICSRARSRFGVPMALVTLVDQDWLVDVTGPDAAGSRTPRTDAFCDHTIRSDDVFVVPDLSLDPRFEANPLVKGLPFLRFYAGAPLTYLRGVRLGALCLLDVHPRELSSGDRAELAQMADEVVAVIVESSFPDPALLRAL